MLPLFKLSVKLFNMLAAGSVTCFAVIPVLLSTTWPVSRHHWLKFPRRNGSAVSANSMRYWCSHLQFCNELLLISSDTFAVTYTELLHAVAVLFTSQRIVLTVDSNPIVLVF